MTKHDGRNGYKRTHHLHHRGAFCRPVSAWRYLARTYPGWTA